MFCVPGWICALGSIMLVLVPVPLAGQLPEDIGDSVARDTDSRIVAVTLYRDRAMVTREFPVPDEAGNQSIVLGELPAALIPESVFAEGAEGVVIRAVRVTPRPRMESNREDIRALDQRVETLERQAGDIQLKIDGFSADLNTLEKMTTLSAGLGNYDVQRGVLNSTTLIEMADWSINRRRELTTEQRQQELELENINHQLELAREELALATDCGTDATYQATVFLEISGAAPGNGRLSYLVENCGWSPQYTVRGHMDRPEVEMDYSGLVRQLTGEDWTNVQLTLSTASPDANAARPQLIPLRVAVADLEDLDEYPAHRSGQSEPFGNALSEARPEMIAEMIESLEERQQDLATTTGPESGGLSAEQRDDALNGLAGYLQEIELRAGGSSLRGMAPDLNSDLSSQIYELANPVSLASRRESQLVRILKTRFEAEVRHVATPLLSSFAYREAQITNTRKLGLLEGPATVYLDERFIGHIQIPSTASGQKMTIGLGADQQVRTRRELVDKAEEIKGGNRQVTFSCRLVISNYKETPVHVRLIDRIPNTQQAQQLSVVVTSTGYPLSDDALYLRMERPTGILRWDIEVPADQHGSDAFDVPYDFSLEFDRNRVPTMQDALSELQAAYDAKFRAGGGFGGGGMGGGFFAIPHRRAAPGKRD